MAHHQHPPSLAQLLSRRIHHRLLRNQETPPTIQRLLTHGIKATKASQSSQRKPIVQDEPIPATLDLALDHPEHQQGTRQFRLQAAELNLSLSLPPSSGPGIYLLNLTRDAAGQQVLATATDEATAQAGKASLKVSFPLQSIAPGDYFLFVAKKVDSGQSNAGQNNGGKMASGQQIFGSGQAVYDLQVVPR